MKTGEGFLLVYSIIQRPTFMSIGKFLDSVLRIKEEYPEIPMVLVGNKCDLRDTEPEEVSTEEGKNFAQKNHMGFIETSAKTNYNVTEAFTLLIREIKRWRKLYLNDKKKKEKNCSIL
jgi:small GTP-binding protein